MRTVSGPLMAAAFELIAAGAVDLRRARVAPDSGRAVAAGSLTGDLVAPEVAVA